MKWRKSEVEQLKKEEQLHPRELAIQPLLFNLFNIQRVETNYTHTIRCWKRRITCETGVQPLFASFCDYAYAIFYVSTRVACDSLIFATRGWKWRKEKSRIDTRVGGETLSSSGGHSRLVAAATVFEGKRMTTKSALSPMTTREDSGRSETDGEGNDRSFLSSGLPWHTTRSPIAQVVHRADFM